MKTLVRTKQFRDAIEEQKTITDKIIYQQKVCEVRMQHLEAALRYCVQVIEKLPPHVDTNLLHAQKCAVDVLHDVVSADTATTLDIDPHYPLPEE